jgi:hypothetical protein
MGDVKVRVHLEFTDGGDACWWADSEELEGFYAAGVTLRDLEMRAWAAISEIAAENGTELGDVSFALIEEPSSSVNSSTVIEREPEVDVTYRLENRSVA